MGIPYRILIVEDHEATRHGLTKVLTNAGYTVLAAGAFAEGRRALTEQAPDLLIADVRLGEYNGLHLVAAAMRAIPTIVITGFPDRVLETEALRLGARYFTKPVAADRLLQAIEDAMVGAAERGARVSTRRWDRKPVAGKVTARVGNAPARIVNISYGGLRFEIERDQSLPRSFRLDVADPAFSVDANLVWEARSGDRRLVCGASISGIAAGVREWASLVDGFSTATEA